MKRCEYIGCNKEAETTVKYEAVTGREIECQVCSDHQNLINKNDMMSAKDALPNKLKAYDATK